MIGIPQNGRPVNVFKSGVLCAFALMAVASCSLMSSKGQPGNLPNVKVQFVDSHTGWIVGPRLLRTTNGGRSWEVVRSGGDGTRPGTYIFDEQQRVQFINHKVGWMLGSNAIHRTVDGGATWPEKFPIPVAAGEYPVQLFFFISPDEGWALGEYLYKTNDEGRSWQKLFKLPSYGAPYRISIWFSDSERGVLGLNNSVYATDDGGKSWQMVWQASSAINSIFFVDDKNGWCVGMQGLVASTADGGRTWAQANTSSQSPFHSVFFTDKQKGCVVGGAGTILYTRDGGATWRDARINAAGTPRPPLISVSFADELHGWAVGGVGGNGISTTSETSNAVLATEDGGQTWRLVQL